MTSAQADAAIEPTRWDADVVAADGGIIHLRPVVPADADRLIAFHNALSTRTKYLRFFFVHDALTPEEVRHYTHVDQVDRFALVATFGDAIIGIGRWDRAPGDVEAEIAFVIADEHQGRGIASILLEHLAAAGRELGVQRFAATVLAQNHAMLRVFADAGYQPRSAHDGPEVELDFAIEETAATERVAAEREQHAEASSIRRLLHPRSVAILGASADPNSVGGAAFGALLGAGFNGPLYPINSQRRHVHGVRAYPSLADVPDEIDLAVVAVPAAAVHDVVPQAAKLGARAVVVMSGGFGEDGDPAGRARQVELVRDARAGGMRVIGPNCLGVANTDPDVGLNATLAPQLPLRGRAGFFCQSGALGVAVLAEARRRGVGVSTFVSAGNRADVSGNDLLQFWETDPATDIALLYLESFGNPRKFARLARRLGRRKPVVVVKSRRAAPPPSLAGTTLEIPDATVQALFESAGVIRVDTITELFDVAAILAAQPLPSGDRVAVVGNSTALGVLVVDALSAEGLVPARVVDIGETATVEQCRDAIAAAVRDERVDAVVALFVPPVQRGQGDELAAAIRDGAAGSAKPVISTFLGLDGIPGGSAAGDRLAAGGLAGGETTPAPGSVPSYAEPERAVRALARVVRYARWRASPLAPLPALDGVDLDAARALVTDRVEAAPIDGAAVPLAAEDVAAVLRGVGIALEPTPEADRDGLAAHLELRDDPAFGSVLSFGLAVSLGLAGRVAAVLDSPSYAVVPLTVRDAGTLIREARSAPLLRDAGADQEALAELALRLSILGDELPQIASCALGPIDIDARDGRPRVRGAAMSVRRPTGRIDAGPRRLRAL
jgi:acyl-CoA synthetase (NDP forming)/RimJ/RimL family protein N-acetyltransferase